MKRRPSTVTDHFLSQDSFPLAWSKEGGWGQTVISKGTDLQSYYASTNYISHQEKKGSLLHRVYAHVQGRMFRHKWNKLQSVFNKDISVFDFGCGTGDFLRFLQQQGLSALNGLEPNPLAKQKAKDYGFAIYSNLTELSSNHRWDCFTFWHVLEHLEQPADTLRKVKKHLTPNARVIVALPNMDSFDAKHYGTHWAAWDVPRHLWHFSKTGFVEWASKEGWQTEAIYPLWFDAFYVSLLSEKYRKNSWPWLRALFIGLLSNLKALFSGNYSSHFFILRPIPSNEANASV